MKNLEHTEQTSKNRTILEATEKIETVMSLDPQLSAYQQQAKQPQISPWQSGSFMGLWCLVLLAQALMFCAQKKQKPKGNSTSTTSSKKAHRIEKSDRYRGEAKVTESEPQKQRPYWTGRVAFQGSYWKARSLSPATLEEGDICEVIGISTADIALIIRPFSK